jgi:hypothetical protein
MKKGVIDKAERLALNEFDKWNDITGFVSEHTSYYYEIQSVIEDAVHIGIQMALNSKVKYDEFGDVKHED